MPEVLDQELVIQQKLAEVFEAEQETFTQEELEKGYNSFYNRYIKRVIDLVLAVVLAAVLLPVYIVISLLIAVESGFPVLYRAQRGGYRDKPFKINIAPCAVVLRINRDR